MILETERLILRKWEIDDEIHLQQFLGDNRVMYAYNGAFDNKKIVNWLQWNLKLYQEKGYGLWAIDRKSDKKIIGECGLTDQIVDNITYLEIGYHLAFDYWHQGYALEAAKGVKEFTFTELKSNEVVSIIRDTNIASMNVAIRNNMTIKKRFLKQDNSLTMPHYLFSVKN